MSEENGSKNGNFETRLQAGVQTVVLGVVLWVGYTLNETVKMATRLESEQARTTKDIAELKTEQLAMRLQVTSAALAASNAAISAAALSSSNAATALAAANAQATAAAAAAAAARTKP